MRYSSIKLAKIKKTDNINYGEDAELQFSYTASRSI